MECIQGYVERNTTYAMQKACVFAGCVLSGHGILEACEMAAFGTSNHPEVGHRCTCGLFLPPV